MKWSLATRHQILLEITNAVISHTSKQEFFNALATELKKHVPCDRLSINLYDEQSQTLKYFSEAAGIDPRGISGLEERSLMKGSIAKMAIQSGQPVIIQDLSRYRDLFSIGELLKSGLTATMAFPLIIGDRTLGTLHFSFKTPPRDLQGLSELLTEVAKQVAIAVGNLVAYTQLKQKKKSLETEKNYLMGESGDYSIPHFYYKSPQMTKMMEMVDRVAGIDAPVFITGETGTGKDFLARYIHHSSPRANHLLVKINCPAIPSTLFETELFGHAKGAFTGAEGQRMGRFEMADKGTIFLDEVGELPASLQAKLLQVLQEKRFDRVGDSRPTNTNFRVIAATNRDPEESIRQGKLRKDLYYRLNIIRIHVPCLRDRPQDIPLLIKQITRDEAAKINQIPPHYDPDVLEFLSTYHWPGNVRELRNMVNRMIILKPGKIVGVGDLEKMIHVESHSALATHTNKIPTLAESEKETICRALERCNGVLGGKSGAARLLGIPRSTLQYRMKKYGINPRKTLSIDS